MPCESEYINPSPNVVLPLPKVKKCEDAMGIILNHVTLIVLPDMRVLT
jgi:hypothetical protein